MANILLVEDDLRLKDTYDIIFKKEGHNVVRAVDGEDALEKVKDFEPDLILLDLMMPKKNGLEFLAEYDPKNKHPNVKVVVFSNMSMPDEMDKAYELGATKYLLKSSVSPKEIADIVAETITSQS